jgi:sn-glycerol 3-phosphate transport system substrate-binding protein
MRFRRTAAVLSILALAVTGCGDDGDGPDDEGASTADPSECPVGAFEEADGVTTIKVWHSYVGSVRLALEKIAAEYNASQDKVKVEIESQGNSYDALRRNFEAGIPNRQLPAITIAEDTNTQFMIDSGVVLPASACLEADPEAAEAVEDIIPAVRAAYTVDGIQYPASMNVSTIVLYYNRGHFAAAGLDPDNPPTTLEGIREAAEKLKAAGQSEKPLALKLDPWFLEQWITGAGETLVNNDNGRSEVATEATIDNEAGRTAIQFVADMHRDGLLNGVPGTEGQINHFLAMLPSGSSSMLLETSAAITTIDGVLTGKLNPEDLGQDAGEDANLDLSGLAQGLDIGVGLNPGIEEPGKGQIGGGAWYITNTGSDAVQSAAWDFVKYFNSTKTQVLWTLDGSYLPILDSVKDDPQLKENWSTTQRGRWLSTAYEGIQSLDADFPGALIGPYDKFREHFRKAIEAVGLQGADPLPALATAEAAITAELENYAESNF